jgi:hypothetical protein
MHAGPDSHKMRLTQVDSLQKTQEAQTVSKAVIGKNRVCEKRWSHMPGVRALTRFKGYIIANLASAADVAALMAAAGSDILECVALWRQNPSSLPAFWSLSVVENVLCPDLSFVEGLSVRLSLGGKISGSGAGLAACGHIVVASGPGPRRRRSRQDICKRSWFEMSEMHRCTQFFATTAEECCVIWRAST